MLKVKRLETEDDVILNPEYIVMIRSTGEGQSSIQMHDGTGIKVEGTLKDIWDRLKKS